MQHQGVLDQKLRRVAQLGVIAGIDDRAGRGQGTVASRLGIAQFLLFRFPFVRYRLFDQRSPLVAPSAKIILVGFDHGPVRAYHRSKGLQAERDVFSRRFRQAGRVIHQKLGGIGVVGMLRLLEDFPRRGNRQLDGRMRTPPLALGGVPRSIQIDIRLHRSPVRVSDRLCTVAGRPFAAGKGANRRQGGHQNSPAALSASPAGRLIHA